MNGVTDATQFEGEFFIRMSDLILDFNRAFEDGAEFRFQMNRLNYVKKYYNKGTVWKYVGKSIELFDICSNGISFVVYAVDVYDTVSRLSMFEAEKEIFDMNMKEIENISLFGSDKYIRAAADDVMELIAGQYLEVFVDSIEDDMKESLGDYILYGLVGKVGYIGILVGTRDIMNVLIDSKTDVQQMYKMFGYSNICEAYITPILLKLNTADNSQYYSCFHFYVEDIVRSLEHIAQLRILGEQEYFSYIKNDGLVGVLEEHFEMLDELKEDITQKISVIRGCASKLSLKMSHKIKYIIE